MKKTDRKQKIWGIVKKVAFALLTGFLIYFFCRMIPLVCEDYENMMRPNYRDREEATDFFWIFSCWESVNAMLAVACSVKLLHMLQNKTDIAPVFSKKARTYLFFAAFILLAVLLACIGTFRDIWKYAYLETGTYFRDAANFFLSVVAANLDIGFMLWLFADWRREKKQEKKVTPKKSRMSLRHRNKIRQQQ